MENLNTCGYCSNQSATMPGCTRCKKIRYCTVDCQTNHWPTHKPNCIQSTNPSVIFVWKQAFRNKPATALGNFWGIGDMLRGIATTFDVCKKLGINFYVDMRYHPISTFFRKKDHPFMTLVDAHINDINFVGLSSDAQMTTFISSNKDAPQLFCTNGFICDSYSESAKLFIKDMLSPNAELDKFIKENTPLTPYTILHFRLGDRQLFNHQQFKFDGIMPFFIKHADSSSILLSDSPQFKKFIIQNYPTYKTYDHSIAHIGNSKDLIALKNTLFEFLLASAASHIKTYSVYEWSSGFIDSIKKIYDVAVTDIRP